MRKVRAQLPTRLLSPVAVWVWALLFTLQSVSVTAAEQDFDPRCAAINITESETAAALASLDADLHRGLLESADTIAAEEAEGLVRIFEDDSTEYISATRDQLGAEWRGGFEAIMNRYYATHPELNCPAY